MRFILPVTMVGMAVIVILIMATIMVTHLTSTDPIEITAGEDIMDGAAVMVGTAMAEVGTVGEAMVGVVDMVTIDNDISRTGSYEISY